MKSDKTTPFWDSSLSMEERLDWLLAEMTLEAVLEITNTGTMVSDEVVQIYGIAPACSLVFRLRNFVFIMSSASL